MATPKKQSPEIIAWLAEHLEAGTYQELADMVFAEFNVQVFHGTLRKWAKAAGLSKELNRSRLEPYKNNSLPIGSEHISDGIVWVKIADEKRQFNRKQEGGYASGKNWRKKAYIVWEQAHGSIPRGKRLVYLDGDSTNCALENLYFTSVGIQMHIARHGILATGNRDLTLAEIKRYELNNALKNLG